MEQAVCLVELVVVDLFGTGQRGVGIGPPPDERPLLRRALGREVPQDAGFHGGALVNELIHDLPVQPGHSGTLVGHDLHQPVLLQPLQNHSDHGTRCPKAGAERVLAQRTARPQGQVDDLPLQYRVNFSVGLVLLFHITHLVEMIIPLAGSPSQSSLRDASSPKVGALGSPRKLHLFAKASPFGRGVTAGDGEGEDVDHVQQPYSKNSFHGAAAGRGREKAIGLPVSGWTNCSPALCRAMSPLNRLPYLPSP